MSKSNEQPSDGIGLAAIKARWNRYAKVRDMGDIPHFHRGLETAHDVPALIAEVERLRELVLEAAASIATWGAYADEYFKKKWNLDGEVAEFKARAFAPAAGAT